VETAENCALARNKLSSETFEIIILDYKLPDGDGLELLEEITTTDDHPPAIMVTGHGDEETAARSFRVFASGYVVKDDKLTTMLTEAVEKGLSELAIKNAEKERERLLKKCKLAEAEITRLSRRVIQEHEETRRKMSADIHDEISQSLNAFKIELDMLRKEEKRLTARAHKRLDAMEELIEYTISTTRGLSAELRPALLDDFGLVEALGLYVEEFSGKTGIKASLECAGLPFELPKDLEIPLFRITQEALVNIQRHANAREVKVSLTHENEQVALTVEDDGEGFDVEKAFKGDAASDCFGLLGMRERARMVGGELEISSKPGSGTTVGVRLPLDPVP